MSRSWRKTQHYRQPTREERSKILFLRYELTELFTDEEITDFMSTARKGIAGEFYFAVEENPRYRSGHGMKRYRGTDNEIIGVGKRPHELARYVASKTHRQIVSDKALPVHLTDLRPKLVEMIVESARYDVILRAINAMKANGEIWYDEATGKWGVRPTTVDDFIADREFRKEVKRALKRDDRSWHGRPNRDRDRGGMVQLA